MLRNLALIAASALVAVLLGEGALRLAGVSYPSFYQEDPVLGGSLRPGASGRWRGEGGSYVQINRDGMRDRDHSIAKPSGTLRIAVLGDSFAEAMAVPREDAFWAVMERELSGCAALGGRKVEVLNFGVSGYGTAQELLMLRERVWKYSPDIVLLAFFTGNDVRNNSRALNQDPAVPYFALQDGRLVLDDSFRAAQRPKRFVGLAALRNHSRLLQLLDRVRVGLTVRKVEAKDNAAEMGLDSEIYAPPKTAAWQDAWRITEALVATMNSEVRAHGAAFWVATLSTGIQVNPDPAARRAFMKRIGVDDLLYPDRRIAALCASAGIPVITLAPGMAEFAEAHHVYLHGFRNTSLGSGHWNVDGNRLAGRLIAARLCAALSGTSHTTRQSSPTRSRPGE